MPLEILVIPALSDNYNFLLHDPLSGETVVVDPSEAAPINAALQAHGWKLTAIWNTHHHADHVGGNRELIAKWQCPVLGYGPDAARIPGITQHVAEGETVRLGNVEAEVLFIPGHTLGHIAYHFPSEHALFCGDTLFSLGCGRLFEGTPQQMHASLTKLAALPDETRVYCAHEYTASNGRFAQTLEPGNADLQRRVREVERLRGEGIPTIPSTIGAEKNANPFLRAGSSEIRGKLEMRNAADVDVFAEIRRRKDTF